MIIFIIISIAAFLIYETYTGKINALGGGSVISALGLNMYTYSDLVTLAQNAGFSGNDALTAAAIAMAESSGNPRAYNPETAAGAPSGKGSYGLWQIYLNAHPEFEGQDLYDSATNATAAYSVFSDAGNSFSPWSTFKNGTYAQFVQGGCCNA
jgi:hypothetical protein